MIIDTEKLRESIEIYFERKSKKIDENKNISDRRAIQLFTAIETAHIIEIICPYLEQK